MYFAGNRCYFEGVSIHMFDRRLRFSAALLVFVFAYCAAAVAQATTGSVLGTVHESPFERSSTWRFEVCTCAGSVSSTTIFSTASQARACVRDTSLRMRTTEIRTPVQVQTVVMHNCAIKSDHSRANNLNSIDNRVVQSLDSISILAFPPQCTIPAFERTTRRQLSSA